MIYFDNAATSWPKPPGVAEAMMHFLNEVGANPGRAGHRLAVEAGRVVYAAREAVAELFNAPDPLRVAFGHNVTETLNVALRGLLHPGDHLNHGSNVVGTLLPVAEVGYICRQHDLLFLVDAAQTGGAYPVDVQAASIDLLGFTGHKSLGGPMGTGGLIVGERVDEKQMEPLKRGGTGSRSEHEEQPDFLPDMLESGTPNAVGLAGLEAGMRWVLERGVEAIRAHEVELTRQLINGLRAIPSTARLSSPKSGSGRRPGVTVYGGLDAELQTATVSFNIAGVERSGYGWTRNMVSCAAWGYTARLRPTGRLARFRSAQCASD
jgi:selenocysteine lyase/cysteine desulfurase